MLQHHYIQANGLTFHVVTAGPPDGPPVILLHGFPEFWYGWRKQIPVLAAAGFRVIVPDQRGYNLSDKPAGIAAYHHESLASDVVGLMHAFGYERFYLAGHDFGAWVSWWTAIRYPERVRRLVILNVPHPSIVWPYAQENRTQWGRSSYVAYFQLPWLPETMLGSGRAQLLTRAMASSGRPDTFSAEEMEQYRRAWLRPGALTGMLNWYRAMARTRLDLLPEMPIHLPTRIIWGEKDVALEAGLARRSLEMCPAGELFMLPQATHWVQHDEAEQVNALLVEFFAGDQPGGAA